MICPDFSSTEWKLRGSPASFVIKRGEFVIERCVGPHCETDENINKFVSDLQVDTWVFQEKIDYLKYHVKPVFKISEFLNDDLLNHPDTVTRNMIYLRKHIIDTEDDLFQIG